MRLRFRRESGDPAALLDAAEGALEDADPQAAHRLARRAAEASAGDPAIAVAALVVEAAALNDLGRFADAERAAARASALSERDAAAWDELATALYRLGRFDEAVAALRRLVDLDPDAGEAWHRLGRALVWVDDHRAAAAAFAQAARLDPDHQVVPVRIAAVEFDRLAGDAWRSVPAWFRARLDNAVVVVEPLPPLDDVEDGFDPDTLGVYEGGTVADEAGMERIVLYQANHEAVCGSLGALREEIRRTMLHEVGHHFGLDHDELPF